MPSKDLVVFRTLVLHPFELLSNLSSFSARSFELPAATVCVLHAAQIATIHRDESIVDKSVVELTK